MKKPDAFTSGLINFPLVSAQVLVRGSACGKRPDEAVQDAATGLLIGLLDGKHAVPRNLNAVGGIEYIKHGDVPSVGVDFNLNSYS